ncbi:glycoside hydrolase family 75 protein [Daldinia decipiens]|uniref:glycoside hydrolase family 75 protein n=1 Tax=Daldinia decipiens TaxID=326647 RepID=UPI0020C32C37|nr:glycoside hydrolase family 75 protein [Daldinia decipiens]KAI1654756.1 glycoside hydrolase family 75 protein [Daldinia decipiens]
MSLKSFISVSALVGATLARDVPSNVRNFYNNIKNSGQCSYPLATGFYSEYNDDNSFSYCGDHLEDSKVIYIQGSNSQFANMDIDCDGTQGGPADDGRCGNSDDTQSITSFADTVRGYGKGVRDLDAKIHPYVVFGNVGDKPGFTSFDPQEHGIKPLSVMAVVCGDKLIYGVWGDENGSDGEKSVVGEASISLATACFGKGITGNNGHDENDVLYIAFTGNDAVPGKNGAKWNAQNYKEFEKSIQGLGDKLIQRIHA